ncbi:MAG: hypothetical protein PHO37_10080 [Kiritimatiellae bacterium]|nr:hypothetical protein [Kiritimatiellia bacterium]
MDKKVNINVNVDFKSEFKTTRNTLGEASEISTLYELKEYIDRLLNTKDIEATGCIEGSIIVNGTMPNIK